MRHSRNQVDDMTAAISSAIRRFLNEEQKEALHKNSSKYQSTEVKGKKNVEQQQQNYLKTESLYDQLVNVLDKLKKIMKRMNTINKIKKPKLNIFNAKLMEFIQDLSNLIETKVFNLKIDKFVISLVEQTNKALTECDRILTSLQKQSSAFCCGRNQETKYTFYRSIISIIGYGPVWNFIPRFSPVIQEKIQRIEIYTPVKYDFENLERLIEKQVVKYWPQEQQKQVEVVRQIRCERAHVDSQIIESKQSAVSSISSQSEIPQIKNFNQQPPNNYIKIEEVTKLKQDLEVERKLRQAHEKLFGFAKPQQTAEAIETYKNIADKMNDKSSLACNALGQIYEQGKFSQSDRQKSEEYYRRSAGLNDPQGLYKMGKYLEKGLIKIPENSSDIKKRRHDQLRAAIDYFEKAAEMNHLDAITDLGYIYEKGIQNSFAFLKFSQVSKSQSEVDRSDNSDSNSKYFIQPNFNYALKYYSIGKKAEFPRAINNLGALLIREHASINERVKGTNLQKGIKYLKKAAQLGYLKAYFNLGKCYENGIGVEKSYENAKKYYQRGGEKGDISCKVEYIKCFFTDGFPKNGQTDDSQLAKLVQLVQQVLVLQPNNKQCLFYVGLFHQRGDGVIKNPQLAYNYVSKSANLDHLPAITKLGDYKYSGFYVKKDLEGAINLYERAAKGGDPQAMINLSLILQKGLIKPTKGSSPDYIKHLQKQALKTSSSNAYLITGLKEQNYKISLNPKHSLNEKIVKAAELGNRDAINLIAKTRRGDNVERVVKFEKHETKSRNSDNKILHDAMRTDRTIPYESTLKKMKSAQNLKTTKL